jgi:hypothetical protein
MSNMSGREALHDPGKDERAHRIDADKVQSHSDQGCRVTAAQNFFALAGLWCSLFLQPMAWQMSYAAPVVITGTARKPDNAQHEKKTGSTASQGTNAGPHPLPCCCRACRQRKASRLWLGL